MFSENIRTVRYKSWYRFVSGFGPDLFDGGLLLPGRYIFRGQGDGNFQLRSSFDRKFESIPISERVRKYERVIKIFSELYSKEFGEVGSEQDVLSAAQHYGLPTRLLDWSSNPFVSAYFAFNSAALSNQRRGSVAIWALDLKSKLIHRQLGLSVFEASVRKNERAAAQLGFFSHLTGVFDTLEQYAEQSDEQEYPLLTRFLLPVSEAQGAFSYLNSAGFNARSLFPDLQGIASAALEEDWLKDLADNL